MIKCTCGGAAINSTHSDWCDSQTQLLGPTGVINWKDEIIRKWGQAITISEDTLGFYRFPPGHIQNQGDNE